MKAHYDLPELVKQVNESSVWNTVVNSGNYNFGRGPLSPNQFVNLFRTAYQHNQTFPEGTRGYSFLGMDSIITTFCPTEDEFKKTDPKRQLGVYPTALSLWVSYCNRPEAFIQQPPIPLTEDQVLRAWYSEHSAALLQMGLIVLQSITGKLLDEKYSEATKQKARDTLNQLHVRFCGMTAPASEQILDNSYPEHEHLDFAYMLYVHHYSPENTYREGIVNSKLYLAQVDEYLGAQTSEATSENSSALPES